MLHKKIHWIPTLVLTGLLIGLGVIMAVHYKDSPGVSRKIIKDANFSIYYPKDKKGPWVADESTIVMNTEDQLLSFSVRRGNNKVSMSEQPTPDSFSDAPQIYQKLLDQLHQYAEIDTVVGKVTLTHPEELKGGQSAVVNTSKGTLMFAHPEHDLTDLQWKEYFNTLRVVE